MKIELVFYMTVTLAHFDHVLSHWIRKGDVSRSDFCALVGYLGIILVKVLQ